MEQNSLKEAFVGARPIYEAFTKNAHVLLNTLISEHDVQVFQIESRTKSAESLIEKSSRNDKDGKYSSLSDVTDLSGLRIIAYLSEDCDKIEDIIRREFLVDEGNSIKKNDDLAPDRFGYQSTHLIISYPESRTSLREFKRYVGLKAEIQIKTLLQHALASIDWKLRYKSPVEAPKILRRRLYRISALLEAADDEFSYVSAESISIRKAYELSIESGDLQVAIDRESVEAFIDADEQSAIIRDAVSKLIPPDFEFTLKPNDEKSTAQLVQFLSALGITSLDEIRKRLDSRPKNISELVERQWRNWGVKSSSTTLAGIMRIIIIFSCSREVGIDIIEKFPFVKEFNQVLLDSLE